MYNSKDCTRWGASGALNSQSTTARLNARCGLGLIVLSDKLTC